MSDDVLKSKGFEPVSDWKIAWAKADGYPDANLIGSRSGIKVDWLLYASEESAKACSGVAWANGQRLASEGYDFGYQCPGSVRAIEGLGWEVVIP